MIDAALDVLGDASGWFLCFAVASLVASVRWLRGHLAYRRRLADAAAVHDPQDRPLDPEYPWVQETWSNVAAPEGGFLSDQPDAPPYPDARPPFYDWSTDDPDLA